MLKPLYITRSISNCYKIKEHKTDSNMQKVLHSLPKQHPFVLGAILFIGAPIGLLLTVGGITTIFGGLVFCMSGLL